MFNFAARLAQAKEVYTYSISPTEPDELISSRMRSEFARDYGVRATLDSITKQAGTMSAQLKEQNTLNELLRYTTAQRSVFGYGVRLADGATTAREDEIPKKAALGWEILPVDQDTIGGDPHLRAKQFAMTALVSLPAWWERAIFKLSLSWIDRSGNASSVGQETQYDVELPMNYETMDARLFDAMERGPTLIDWQIPSLTVRPCHPFTVTISGRRLWRSTVVTLGGERASQVVVLPNMNGIIATFDKPKPAGPPPIGVGAAALEAPLTVWTSQGSVTVPRTMTFEALPTGYNWDCSVQPKP